MSQARTPESRPDRDARPAGRSAVRSLRSVRLAVAVSIVLMTVVALAIIGYLAGEVRERHVSSSRTLVLSVGQTVDEMVGSIDATLLVSADEIAHQIAEARVRPAAITRFLGRQQERFPFIDLLRATTDSGEAVFGKGVDPEQRASLAHRDYFKQLRDDPNLGLVIAEPLVGQISQRWIWLMARRIANPDGSFAGVVYGSMFIDDIVERFNKLKLPPGSAISLRDREMRLVARATFDDTPPVPIGNASLSKGLETALSQNPWEGVYESGDAVADGVSRLYTYWRSERHGFTLLVGTPMTVIDAEWRRQSAVVLGVLAILILGVLGLGRVFSRSLRERLAREAVQARDSERVLLKTLIRSIPQLVWFKDPDGIYLACNDEFERFFGHPEAAIVGRSDYAFLPREVADSFRGHDQLAAAAASPTVNEEWVTYAEDGRRVLLNTTKTPVFDDAGQLVGVLGIAFDITQSRQHEEALRQSEATLDRAQSVAHIGSWALDIAAGSFDVSKETYRIFGLATGEKKLAIDDFIERIHPDDRAGVIAAWKRALKGADYDIEHRVFVDNEIRWVHDRAVMERDAAGCALRAIGTVQDVTDWRLVLNALDESALFLRESQGIARVGGWKVNPESGYLMWTDEIYRLVEHPVGQAIDLEIGLQYYSPEDLPEIRKLFEAAWNENEGFVRECRLVSRSGRSFWGELRCIGRVRDPDGDYLAGTFQDISERKEAEAGLEHERRMRETFMESIPGVFYAIDASGSMIFWNSNFERITGRSADELRGMKVLDLFDGDDRDLFAERMAEVFEYGASVAEADLVAKDGARYPYFFTGSLVDVSGMPLLVGTGIDVSARRKAEDALRQLNANLELRIAERTAELSDTNERLLNTQFAMEEVGIGISWVDFDSGRFTYANQHAAAMLGYSVDEYLGLCVWDIDPHFPVAAYQELSTDLKQKEHMRFESEQRTRDGRLIPVEISIHYQADRSGGAQRLIVFQSDISARRETQHVLVAAKEAAEVASRAKSAFLANMSHEIRTPLNAILGLNHLMRSDDPPPRQLHRLEKMETAGRHLLGLINDILDLSKIEAGGLLLEERDFPLAAILDSVADIIRDTAHGKGLVLTIEHGDVPAWLHGDETRLRQAILNFAGNAVKFTERGSIAICAQLLDARGDDLQVRFEVRDSGIGLSPEQCRRLFQAFEQADKSTSRKYGGTGLGLALTKRLVELMGGRVGVDSDPGKGSTFWFEVPLQRGKGARIQEPGAAGHEAPPVRLRSGFSGARILIAEDNEVNVEVVRELLVDVGLSVAVACNGREAVEFCRAEKFALVLMDMQMPELDGPEATREIRRGGANAATPIIALTANAFAEDRRACLDAGMDDVLTKPVDPDLLYEALARGLSQGGASARVVPAAATPAADPAAAGADECDDALARLQADAGVDVAQGLRSLAGKRNKYLELLQRFLDGREEDPEHLQGLLADGDRAAACRLAHSLKGAASALGLTPLVDIAGPLEATLRASGPAPDGEQLQEMLAGLREHFARIRSALPVAAAEISPAPTVPAALIQKTVAGLDALLEQSDMAAIGYFDANEAVIRAATGGRFGMLAQQLRGCNFDAALLILRAAPPDQNF